MVLKMTYLKFIYGTSRLTLLKLIWFAKIHEIEIHEHISFASYSKFTTMIGFNQCQNYTYSTTNCVGNYLLNSTHLFFKIYVIEKYLKMIFP